ncbi:hypothetical protein RRG08_015301 [Elysia crispata]|uniref:Uncharacterized protein n=1 Tax=Elysia crispata TaxID=231223 RepID=A0AAE1DLY5_9GAST|nr:hypothetical protein RRG08_015301 [Elysia crispata]
MGRNISSPSLVRALSLISPGGALYMHSLTITCLGLRENPGWGLCRSSVPLTKDRGYPQGDVWAGGGGGMGMKNGRGEE